MPVINPRAVCQIALVVRDIEKTARSYAELFGVPVPEIFTIPPVEEAHTRFRGRLTKTRAKLAVFQMGQIVLELTEPDGEPSSWREFLERHGEGVHHVGFMVDDLNAALSFLERKGIRERHSGDYPGGRYVFVESAEQLGVLLNLKYEPRAPESAS